LLAFLGFPIAIADLFVGKSSSKSGAAPVQNQPYLSKIEANLNAISWPLSA
jgi:hypothetical protein